MDESRIKDLYEAAEIIESPSSDPNDKLYEKIIEDDWYTDDYAYVDWHDNIDLIMKKQHKATGKCDFQVANEKFLTQRLAFAFAKDNPWVEKFNHE